MERQEELLGQRRRNVDRSRDLPEDVAFEQSHAAVWRSRPGDREREDDTG